jgi:N-acetylmuramoyl-L-alanine amidase
MNKGRRSWFRRALEFLLISLFSVNPLLGERIAIEAGHGPVPIVRRRDEIFFGYGTDSHKGKIKLSYPENPLVIDSGYYKGCIPEYRLTEDIARRLGNLLEADGHEIVYTRINRDSTDFFGNKLSGKKMDQLYEEGLKANPENPSIVEKYIRRGDHENFRKVKNLIQRGQVANDFGADILIDIHINGYWDSKRNGFSFMVYHMGNKGMHDREFYPLGECKNFPNDIARENFERSITLAKYIYEEMEDTRFKDGMVIKPEELPWGTIYGRDSPLLGTYQTFRNGPAILIETGYATNPNDMNILADPSNRQKIAEALHNGIMRYIRNENRWDFTY